MDESMDDFLEELGFKNDDANFHTTVELMEKLGIADRTRMHKCLKRLKELGRLQVRKVPRLSIDDKNILVSAYRILPKKGKRKK